MKYIGTLFICCIVAGLLSSNSSFATSPDSVNRLIVTAKAQSPVSDLLLQQGASAIEDYFEVAPSNMHSIAYVNPTMLEAIAAKMQSQAFLAHQHESLSFLQRTFVFEFENSADSKAMYSYLQRHADIENVEYAPERHLLFDCEAGDPLASSQYHLELTKAVDAWQQLSDDEIVIAIVDTGIDYLHEDLRDVMYENPGEIGEDSHGNNKRTNGIDDDGNGYVDDFMGWDMYLYNNHPLPGNGHGTHVAGIAGANTCNGTGVAGVFPYAKLMPLKIGPDEQLTLTWRGHEAILYAAYQGADVINCSWGGTDYSLAEHHIVKLAIEMGSFIVGAAGNAGFDALNYPAAYREVFSVANTDQTDIKVSNSSYNVSVDVSAPGSRIVSTEPDDNYGGPSWTGTSMSSPVVAGVAAMVLQQYPHLSKDQLAAWLRTSVDDIYEQFNQQYIGKLGSGRINALKALDNTLPRKAMSISSIGIHDQNGDGLVQAGESVQLSFTATNHFDALTNLQIRVAGADNIPLDLIDQTASVGPMSSGQVYLTELGTYEMSVSSEINDQRIAFLRVEFIDDGEVFDWDFIRVVINQNIVTLHENAMTMSLAGEGSLGYGDYPDNEIGDGIRGMLSENVMFGGGLMIGSDKSHVSSAVFESYNSPYTSSFSSVEPPTTQIPGQRAQAEAYAHFVDGNKLSDVGVEVRATMYQYTDDNSKNRTILKYNLTNTSGFDYPEMYCGLFFDFDVSPLADKDVMQWASQEECLIIGTPEIGGYPEVGMTLVSPQDVNAVGLHNFAQNNLVIDGSTKTVSLNQFSIEEKWDVLRAGTQHGDANEGDLSACLSAGPFELKDGESTDVVFVIFFGHGAEDLIKEAQRSREDYERVTAIDKHNRAHTLDLRVLSNGSIVQVQDEQQLFGSIQIVDLLGNIAYEHRVSGRGNSTELQLPQLTSGTYVARFVSENSVASQVFTVVQ